jgi:sulfur-oxidizing protein SoxY
VIPTNHSLPASGRRKFLQGSLALSALGVAAVAGIFKPLQALAADWPKSAFEAKKLDDALNAVFGSADATPSPSVKIKASPQAENGAVVPISVSTDLANVESIAVFVEKNAAPLIAFATFSGAEGYLSARMKMAQTSDVVVVVKAGGKLYSAKQNIKVTVGGCGG